MFFVCIQTQHIRHIYYTVKVSNTDKTERPFLSSVFLFLKYHAFKMPKNITSEVREIILKVKEFMDEEKRMQVPIIPLSKVYVRVSAATGSSTQIIIP